MSLMFLSLWTTRIQDGQEAKELPQGGSLRDNVDTSVTVKRTFSYSMDNSNLPLQAQNVSNSTSFASPPAVTFTPF